MNTIRRRASQKRYQRTVKGRETNRRACIRWRYGLTEAAYVRLLIRQEGKCALCRRAPSARRTKFLFVDHKGDRVRGLLCIRCNSAIGQLGDDVAGLLRALRYVLG